jgi:hypothetical protein
MTQADARDGMLLTCLEAQSDACRGDGRDGD